MPRTRSLAWSELKIGLVSVFALVMAALVIFMVSGEGGFFWERYSIKSVFPDIQGLKEGAPVRVAGVEVGSVTGMAFVGDHVEVTMQVNKDQQPRSADPGMGICSHRACARVVRHCRECRNKDARADERAARRRE